MASSRSVMVRVDKGIEGDRYFKASNRRGPDYQLTPIEREAIDAFNATFGTQLSLDAPRRNIVTSGVRLSDLCGHRSTLRARVLTGQPSGADVARYAQGGCWRPQK